MRIRKATAEDELGWFELRNDPETRTWSGRQAPIDRDQHAAWFSERLNDPGSCLIVGEDGGELVGYLRVDWSMTGDIAIAIAPTRRGHGLGSMLLQAINPPWSARYLAWIHPTNAASLRLFEKAGYQQKAVGLTTWERR